MNFNKIDFRFPVEVVPFQYDAELPSFLVCIEGVESISLYNEQAKLFLGWLLEGPTAKYWQSYVDDGECTYVDLDTGKTPYCIMIPLVVFRYHFCQWSKEQALPEMSLLLDMLFHQTQHWREVQSDMVSINCYLKD